MPQLINSNYNEASPDSKIEKAISAIIYTFLDAHHHDKSKINDAECDLVLSCCRVISELRSKLQ